VFALAALVGVKWQIDSAERIQREQSARDIYREYLNLAINKPEFAQANYCSLASTPGASAYENFVEYLLYTAEQAISVDESWRPTFAATLADHAQYICQLDDVSGYSEPVAAMLENFKHEKCGAVVKC
jgi:hypothetical protein